MTLAYERRGSSTSFYDSEFAASVFLTRRTLDGFHGQGRTIGGKATSDEEWAFRIQSDYLAEALRVIEDARIARMLEEGVETDDLSLGMVAIPTEAVHIVDTNIIAPQPVIPRSPAKLDTDFTTAGILEDFTDSPNVSRSPIPELAPSSSSQDDTPHVGEDIRTSKGKEREVGDDFITVDSSPTFDEEDLHMISEDEGRGRSLTGDIITINPPLTLDETPFCDEEDILGISEDKGKGRSTNDIIIVNSPPFDETSLCDEEHLPETPEDKGKGRSITSDTTSDEEYALKIQSEDLQSALQVMEDAQLAKSLDEGAEVRHPSLKQPNYTNEVAIALRQAALTVAAKNGLPGPSSLPHERKPSSKFIVPATIDKSVQMVDTHKTFVSRFLTPEHISGLGSTSNVLYPYTERPKLPTSIDVAAPKQDDESLLSMESPAQSLCIICEDPVTSADTIRTPCDHDYCRDCIVSYVDASTRDNSLLPVRCCNLPIPKKAIIPFLTNTLLSFFEVKSRELDVPVNHRMYCQSPDCSTFLGSSQTLTGNVACPKCGSSTCTSCKQSSHIGESCSDNAGILEVKALARVEHWQTCPGCKAIVELQQGCYHMTCRCATQFCYLCAAPWKTCRCPQWEERRL